ncbi:MAG TPA: hypothetical protein VHE13_11575 [Opitutus sp.]|nr:hypothetical protein [Opitutus sp.]
MTAPERPTADDSTDNTTGLPGLRSWRAVYVVVLGIFVLWIVLLAVFTAHYS